MISKECSVSECSIFKCVYPTKWWFSSAAIPFIKLNFTSTLYTASMNKLSCQTELLSTTVSSWRARKFSNRQRRIVAGTSVLEWYSQPYHCHIVGYYILTCIPLLFVWAKTVLNYDRYCVFNVTCTHSRNLVNNLRQSVKRSFCKTQIIFSKYKFNRDRNYFYIMANKKP